MKNAARWTEAIEGWSTWARSGDMGEGSIKTRTSHLRRLARTYRDRPPEHLTVDDLAAFIGHATWSAETKKSARASCRSLYSWMATTGRIDVDPSAPLPRVRVPRARPRPAPSAVCAEAIRAAGERERLMLLLARFEGLRRAEIAGVHSRDIDGGWLRVKGKGGHVRRIPLHPVVARALEQAGEGWVFPSPMRPGRPMTADAVGRLVSAALPAGWTAHNLRHRAGTDWHAVQRDMRAVQELLGHASIRTTQLYVEVADDAMLAAVLGVVA